MLSLVLLCVSWLGSAYLGWIVLRQGKAFTSLLEDLKALDERIVQLEIIPSNWPSETPAPKPKAKKKAPSKKAKKTTK